MTKKRRPSTYVDAKKRQSQRSAVITGFHKPLFQRLYVLVSLGCLLITSTLWASLGARVQQLNADQLVNVQLFQNWATFRTAWLPSQHSYVLKWPLFWLVHLLGASTRSLSVVTVLVVLLTVSSLVYIIYRINSRPYIFGTLCLVLASVLLLVPTQPYPGALLPVNMAMLTTRNIEYIIFIISLFGVLKAKRLRSWMAGLSVVVLGLLIASDRLFLYVSLGGAVLALVIYTLSRRWQLATLFARWLVIGLVAGLLAVGLLASLNGFHALHLIGDSTGPYGLQGGLHSLIIGSLFALLGLLTNVGANPAYSTTILRQLPHDLVHNTFQVGFLAFLVNSLFLVVAVWCLLRLLVYSFIHKKDFHLKFDLPAKLSLLLLWSSLAAVVIFVGSKHDYGVDARYLTLWLFTIFIASATVLRTVTIRPKFLFIGGCVTVVALFSGSAAAVQRYHHEQAAMATIDQRNSLVSQALTYRSGHVLVGNYWRVVPIKQQTSGLTVTPLSGCTQKRDTLTSQAWQPNLQNTAFTYLLTLDKGLSDYPACTLDSVVASYGRPNSSTLIAGNLSHPKELLLNYDNGLNKSGPTKVLFKQPSTVVPIALNDLPNVNCDKPTVLQIVAHQDDDLLFMNPDTKRAIDKGYCVRTVFLTAGDAGSSSYYWLDRQKGSEAAYDYMDGPPKDIWIERIVKIAENEYATVASPRNNDKISLVFLHLPDGGLRGNGFKSTNHESLARLYGSKISVIHSVDQQSFYSYSELVKALTSLMYIFQPTEIRTQAAVDSKHYPDHSDHITTGEFTKLAYTAYEQEQYDNQVVIPLHAYVGYPIRDFPPNVTGNDLTQKETAFQTYSLYDSNVCFRTKDCHTSAYNFFILRQYQNSNVPGVKP